MKIGLDLDNTLICYGTLFSEVARERNLLTGAFHAEDKTGVRERIRTLPGGEEKWQRLQARVYGEELHRANMCRGAAGFLQFCKKERIPVVIVSHKTRFASRRGKEGGSDADLHQAALCWLKRHEFFGQRGLGMAEEGVFFEESRGEKIARIHREGCSHFIDDLPEIFTEPDFPAGVVRILYGQSPKKSVAWDHHFGSWDEIRRFFSDGGLQGGRCP